MFVEAAFCDESLRNDLIIRAAGKRLRDEEIVKRTLNDGTLLYLAIARRNRGKKSHVSKD